MQEDVFQRYVVLMLMCVYVNVSKSEVVMCLVILTLGVWGLQGLTFNSMWSEGRHFRTRKIDESRTTNDCGIMGNFDTSTDEVRYCGTIERILKVNFRSIHIYLFRVPLVYECGETT